jgi:tetratricopeptide (TPR) repeat protein
VSVRCLALRHTGDAHLLLRHFATAIVYHQALRLYEQAADQPWRVADALNAIGWSHAWLDDYEQARTYCERALAMFREYGHTYDEANALDRLAETYTALDRHAEARAAWQRAATLYRSQHRTTEAERVEHRLTERPMP